jgi:O-antigen/teichoic acid export membrane protein
VLPPPLCRLWDEGKQAEAEVLVSQSLRLFHIIAIPFIVGALLAGPSVVALLTTPAMALASRWAVALIAGGMLLYGMVILLSSVAFVTRQTTVILNANIIAVVGNLGLNLLILPFYPTVTIPAAVSVLAYGLSFSYAAWKIRHFMRLSFHWPTIARALLAAAGMAALLIALGYWPGTLAVSSVTPLALHISGAIVTYFALFLLVGGLSTKDRALVLGLLRRRVQG